MSARDWNERYASTELLWSAEPNEFVEEVASSLAPGRALDLACGEGRNSIWLARRGWDVTGVDFSSAAIEKAARIAETAEVNVDWVCADVVSYQPEPDSLDFVVLCHVHLPPEQMATVLHSAERALVIGGSLCVVGHARANLTDGYSGPQDPHVLYEPEEIVAVLAGLDAVRAEHVTREVETSEGPRRAIDTLVVATRRA